MLMGLHMCSWTAGSVSGKWEAGIWQSDAVKKKTKTQAHIKLLNGEETSVGSLCLSASQKAQDSAMLKARSTRDRGFCHTTGFRPEEFVS